MIVCLRLEVTDEERSVLSLRSNPKALKRLATGAEMKALIADLWAGNLRPQDDFVAPCADDQLPQEFFTPEPAVRSIDEQIIPAPVVVEPVRGISAFRKLLHHVNCAMFSLSMARRMSETHATDSTYQLNKLVRDVELLRGDLATEHDADFDED